MQLWRKQLESPFLPIHLVASDDSLVEITLESERDFDSDVLTLPEAQASDAGWKVLEQASEQLQRYLAGEKRAFELPLYFTSEKSQQGPTHLTEFQKQVLLQLARLPAGEVVSYGELAELAGRPGASRAVGTAVGKNPFPIVIPCHRVLAAGNNPGGYAAGGFGSGLGWKFWLLQHEGFTFPFLR